MGTARQATIQHSAFEAKSVSPEPVSPVTPSEPGQTAVVQLSPYKAARARTTARIQARLSAPPLSEQDALALAFKDLLVLFERVNAAATRVEADPLGVDREAIPETPDEPILTVKNGAKTILLDDEDEWYDVRDKQRDSRTSKLDISQPIPLPQLDEPEIAIAVDPDVAASKDPKRREKVASGLVDFHRDMEVPRVAPFIINPGQNGSVPAPSDDLD